jgi:hypothetical protein
VLKRSDPRIAASGAAAVASARRPSALGPTAALEPSLPARTCCRRRAPLQARPARHCWGQCRRRRQRAQA